MDAIARLEATLAGRTVDRILNFDLMMTRAAHQIGAPLSRYYLDHRVLVEANYAAVADLGLDLVQAISDPYREAADLGSPVEFPEDGLPVLKDHLLSDPSRLGSLRVVDPGSGARMSDRLEAVRTFSADVGSTTPVLGWVEGAIAEAADLRGVGSLMTDLYDNPEWVLDLLELCTEQAIFFARAQVDAGATIVGVGDAIASQISPRMYQRFALPYEKRIIEAIHEAGARARLHICGDTSRLLKHLIGTRADIIDVDWMVPLADAVVAFEGIAVCGNHDPVKVMLQGSPEDVYAATRECRRIGGPRFISMAGCEVPDGTSTANLLAQRRALDEPMLGVSGAA